MLAESAIGGSAHKEGKAAKGSVHGGLIPWYDQFYGFSMSFAALSPTCELAPDFIELETFQDSRSQGL